jgi:acyl carrier protein
MSKISESTREEVKEIVCNFFSEECEVEISRINEDTNIISDLEGDSLMFLELIEIFKKKYDLNIELKTIAKYIVKHPVETIGQLIDTQMLMIIHENKIVELA